MRCIWRVPLLSSVFSLYSETLGTFLLALESETAILPLLLFDAELPLLCNLHVVVFEPNEVLTISPIWGQNLFGHIGDLSHRLILLDVPVLLSVDDQGLEPATLNVAYLFNQILALLKFGDLCRVLTIYKLRGGLWVLEWLALINHPGEVVLLAAFCFAPEPSLFIGAEDDNCLAIVRQVLKYQVPRRLNGTVAHHSTAQFKVSTLEADVLSVSKFDIVWASQPWF